MPVRQQIHIDRALTNISVAYMQSEDAFIADRVFPVIPVQKQSDVYFVYSKADFLRDEATERAQGTESSGSDYNVDIAPPYFCRKYAHHKDVTQEERVNTDSPLDADQDATEFVSQKLLLKKENLWVSTYMKAGVWGRDLTGVTGVPTAGQFQQFDLATSDPIKLITDEAIAQARITGKRPNTLVFGPEVFNAFKNHDDILDRIKYTQKGMVTLDLLAGLFEVERILVPWAIQNKAVKGDAANMDFIHGKSMLLCYVERNPGLRKASAGYTFAWKGLMGASAMGSRVLRIPMPWLGMDTERVEAEMAFDHKVVAADMGTYFAAVVK